MQHHACRAMRTYWYWTDNLVAGQGYTAFSSDILWREERGARLRLQIATGGIPG